MTHTSITRLLRGALLAIALATAPSLAAAAQRGPIIGDVGTIKIGGSAGLFASSFSTGVALHLDGVYTISEIQPRLFLEGAGHIGAMFGSNSVSVWEAIPKARIRYALDDKLSLYGDGGLGLSILHVSVPEIVIPGVGTFGGSSNTLALLIRFAGGVQYALAPNIFLMAEPLGLNIYTASGSGFAYTLLVGALFRI